MYEIQLQCRFLDCCPVRESISFVGWHQGEIENETCVDHTSSWAQGLKLGRSARHKREAKSFLGSAEYAESYSTRGWKMLETIPTGQVFSATFLWSVTECVTRTGTIPNMAVPAPVPANHCIIQGWLVFKLPRATWEPILLVNGRSIIPNMDTSIE